MDTKKIRAAGKNPVSAAVARSHSFRKRMQAVDEGPVIRWLKRELLAYCAYQLPGGRHLTGRLNRSRH